MFVCMYFVLLVVVVTCFCFVYGGGFEIFFVNFQQCCIKFLFFFSPNLYVLIVLLYVFSN